jgi:drug/metabolite transporter (DMT)-like permease
MSSAFFFHISAVRIGELSFIAPFSYIGILTAVFYGFVVWGELPNTPMIFGIILIIISGLYILSHQNVLPIKQNNSNL